MVHSIVKLASSVALVTTVFLQPAYCQTQVPEKIEIKLRKVGVTTPAALVKRITLVPIEYRADAQISNIFKVQFIDNQYYILDKLTRLIVTYSDGKILRVLNKPGQGPGEYTIIHDFDIDPVSKNLWINDGQRGIVQVYSPELKPLFSRNLQTPNIMTTPWDPSKQVVQNQLPDPVTGKIQSIQILDREGKLITQFLESGPVPGFSTGGFYRLQSLTGAIDFWPPFSSLIYRITEKNCYPVYEVSFDEPIVKPGTQITGSLHPEVLDQTFYESEPYLLIECMISGKVFLTFYNKKTGKIITIRKPWNSVSDEGYIYQTLGFINNLWVLWAINLDIIDLVWRLDPDGTKLANKKILDGIDPESQSSNPILVFVDLN